MKFHKDGTKPLNGQIFVFGSNLAGCHLGGAARAAMDHYGAAWKEGIGRWGQSYAIPTMDLDIKPLPLEEIRPYVSAFISHVIMHPDNEFFVTRIGCVIAGRSDRDMAHLFADSMRACNKDQKFGNLSFAEEWRAYL